MTDPGGPLLSACLQQYAQECLSAATPESLLRNAGLQASLALTMQADLSANQVSLHGTTAAAAAAHKVQRQWQLNCK